MLARLQRAILLGLLVAAALWLIAWISAGSAFIGALGALTIMFGHAVVLGIEFVLLRFVNRGDAAAPLATDRQLLRAWWAETRTAALVFGWRQPFCAADVKDWLPAQAPRRAVVLVHGFVCNRGFWNPWMQRLRRGDVPYVAINLEPVFASIDDYADLIEDAVQRAAGTGMKPVLVAHSMGGLAVRAWLGRFTGGARVERIVTIGTPHRGTWLGRFAMTKNARQMHLGSAWHRALAASDPLLFICFYSHCDNIVFPSSCATLPGADNRHVPGVAHVELAFRDEVYEEVLRLVGLNPASAPRA